MSRSASAASWRSTASPSTLSPGQIAGLIGPNGAGKTTLFNCLSRLYTPNGGDILFEGQSILREPRHAIPQHRHRPHLPERGAVRPHVGARQRQGRLPQPHLDRASSTNALRLPQGRRPRSAHITERAAGADRLHGPRAVHQRAGRRPAVPGPQARRARARARRQPQAAAARRAGRRPQPRRDRRAARPDPARARHAARHRAAGRAPHEPGHVGVRQGRRHRLRQARSPTARRPRCSAIPR